MRKNKVFENVETRERFELSLSQKDGKMKLISAETGRIVDYFFECAFTSQVILLSNKVEVTLNSGEFYEITLDRPLVVGSRFSFQKEFKKVFTVFSPEYIQEAERRSTITTISNMMSSGS